MAGRDAAVEAQMVLEDLLPRLDLIITMIVMNSFDTFVNHDDLDKHDTMMSSFDGDNHFICAHNFVSK